MLHLNSDFPEPGRLEDAQWKMSKFLNSGDRFGHYSTTDSGSSPSAPQISVLCREQDRQYYRHPKQVFFFTVGGCTQSVANSSTRVQVSRHSRLERKLTLNLFGDCNAEGLYIYFLGKIMIQIRLWLVP